MVGLRDWLIAWITGLNSKDVHVDG